MGSNHLSSTAPQNKTIIVQLPMIDICFRDFQNHAKNGDSGPLIIWWSITNTYMQGGQLEVHVIKLYNKCRKKLGKKERNKLD